ncbi:MAG: septum formation initiator family protein [Clostridia bacterium]|nr:septum formation initiator family protein [Clostridia bacterium]MBR2327610.1 septum formation initiator family protein [Clostridia bacterium]
MFGKAAVKKLIQIVAIAFLAVMVFTVIKGTVDVAEKQSEIEDLKAIYLSLENEKAELSDLLTADERDIIERYARMKYNYSYPGETVYNDITKR